MDEEQKGSISEKVSSGYPMYSIHAEDNYTVANQISLMALVKHKTHCAFFHAACHMKVMSSLSLLLEDVSQLSDGYR
jgi:hypothetical protein